jgi:hypothetical protein
MQKYNFSFKKKFCFQKNPFFRFGVDIFLIVSFPSKPKIAKGIFKAKKRKYTGGGLFSAQKSCIFAPVFEFFFLFQKCIKTRKISQILKVALFSQQVFPTSRVELKSHFPTHFRHEARFSVVVFSFFQKLLRRFDDECFCHRFS